MFVYDQHHHSFLFWLKLKDDFDRYSHWITMDLNFFQTCFLHSFDCCWIESIRYLNHPLNFILINRHSLRSFLSKILRMILLLQWYWILESTHFLHLVQLEALCHFTQVEDLIWYWHYFWFLLSSLSWSLSLWSWNLMEHCVSLSLLECQLFWILLSEHLYSLLDLECCIYLHFSFFFVRSEPMFKLNSCHLDLNWMLIINPISNSEH